MVRQYNGTNTEVSDRDLWRTPPELFAALNREFNFTCDVAASDENHLCPHYLTHEMDALSANAIWGEVNFCNPPYSSILPWVVRSHIEAMCGKTTVMLIPADTSTKWFKLAFETASEIRFISGRLAFIHNATGKKGTGNNKGSVLFVWRGNFGGCRSVSLIDRDYLVKNHDQAA